MPNLQSKSARFVLACAVASSLCALGVTATAAITSDLQIEADNTFELGGGQEGAFAIKGHNSGPVAVGVLSKAEDSPRAVSLGTIAPGAPHQARFGPGEMALLRNTSARQMARMQLVITGDTSSLGMTYSDNPSD